MRHAGLGASARGGLIDRPLHAAAELVPAHCRGTCAVDCSRVPIARARPSLVFDERAGDLFVYVTSPAVARCRATTYVGGWL